MRISRLRRPSTSRTIYERGMNIKETKKPSRRIDVKYLSSLGIQAYDADNLYPQNVAAIVAASSTGTTCCNRYADFIEGNGFASQTLADFVVNRSGDRFDDIHHLCAADLAKFNGFALHVNYNVLGEIVELSHVPFENCRLEESDEEGRVSHIAVHPDWSGKMTRNGKPVKVNRDTVDLLPVFNPNPRVVQAQIVRAGGIEFFKGQILWVSSSGAGNYPTAKFDAVLTEMSTDEGLSNVKHRNVRNNFLTAGMLVHKNGQMPPDDGKDDSGYSDELAKLQGDSNSLKILEVELDADEEIPQFVSFNGENYDKEFTVTDSSVIERIYSAFGQEAFYCIRSGKIGFSGTLIYDAKLEYAQRVHKEQRMLTRAYKTILGHWDMATAPILNDQDIEIEPIVKAVNAPQA